MSLHLEFEPHSWYMAFAIRDTGLMPRQGVVYTIDSNRWHAYTDNGNTYRVDELQANTLKELKERIRGYHVKKGNWYGEQITKRKGAK